LRHVVPRLRFVVGQLCQGYNRPPELLLACDRIIDVFYRLRDPTPERYFLLLSLVLGKHHRWSDELDCPERRDMAIQLFGKLARDVLQLSNPDAGVAWHG
jgi:hypothetical protein